MTTKTPPDHGTLHRRKAYACKCDDCRAVDREYTNNRSRQIAYGRWQPLVDAEPARQHVRDLMAYGIGWERVAELAGISNGGLSKLLYGDAKRGLAPTKRIRAATAEKILAIKPTLADVADAARIDSTGTRRRLQALVANGWPITRLGVQLGYKHPRLVWGQIRKERVSAATARAVRELYEQLWNARPEDHGIQPGHAARARALAASNGWVPPAAWDDEVIDGPGARPYTGDHAELNRDDLAAHRRAEIEHLDSYGVPDHEIAARIGISESTVRAIVREIHGAPRRERRTSAA